VSEPAIDCDPDAIATLVRAGDVAALDRMTRCFGDRLLAVGRKTCGCDDRARDAVQDAMLAAGEHLADFRGDGSLEGWLVRMVSNACRRMQRGGKHAPHAELDEAMPAGADSPEVEAARGEVMHRIGEVIVELAPRDRAIVILADAEDWTAPEIAEHLGMTADAVRARLSRAHKALRARLLVTVGEDDGSGSS
jgi:RNA polymerase sigma-70 factor (ECF subfamily)